MTLEPRRPRARLFGLGALTLAASILLFSMGVWQLHRLSWKEALIAEIKARAYAAPGPLPPIGSWPNLNPPDYDYRHVLARGTFAHDKEVLVFRTFPEPGYHVLTPLRLASGGYVLVNRGFVPSERKDPGTRLGGQLAGLQTVTGLMRRPEERSFLTPLDDPAAGQYFTADPKTVGKQLGLAPFAPFLIDVDAVPVPGGWPRGGTTVLALPNNHLSYALTWFGLALTLLGGFASFAWQDGR